MGSAAGGASGASGGVDGAAVTGAADDMSPVPGGAGEEEDAPGPVPAGATCRNCDTPLLGPHCYACGQPVKGLVRHFSSILGDFLDSVLTFDGRTPRTLLPLFARPGHLTCEYFEGRRMRYVSPVRLFFFLSIVTFFVAQLTLHVDGDPVVANDAISAATSEAEVEQLRDEALARLREARVQAGDAPPARAALQAGEAAVLKQSGERIAALRLAGERGEPPPPAAEREPEIRFAGDAPWHPVDNPLRLGWLPGFANDWLNRQVGRARGNISRLQEDPERFKDAMLGAIPSTLLVLLPLFALLLKLLYVFRRRLYMEHLIVALHSHAFLSLALLLVFVVMALRAWLAPDPGFARAALGWVEAGLFAWMPLYLLLMQKRVYRQGWPMTLLKYAVLGMCYLVLISLGAVYTVLASLVWM
jgi:hypothetical protein